MNQEALFSTLFRLRLLATWVRRGVQRQRFNGSLYRDEHGDFRRSENTNDEDARALGVHLGLYMRDALALADIVPSTVRDKELSFIVGAQG